MIFGFLFILAAGHFYCCLLVLLINTLIFNQILTLKRDSFRDTKVPFFHLINWYFFAVTELISSTIFLKDRIQLLPFEIIDYYYQYFSLIIFILFVFGVVLFVISLRKGQYKYQFNLLAWTILTCLFVVTQSTAGFMNIYNGLFWLMLPSSIVIVNDCSAYLFGVFLGRTPLIKLSPNKTWQGFIGAFFTTVIWSFFVRFIQFTKLLVQFPEVICPQPYITLQPFAPIQCELPGLLSQKVRMLPVVFEWVGMSSVVVSDIEIYAIIFGFFGGFIAPFGGFFASGVKRAFKIKDFGDSIPGHGGITDRMDCQIMMIMFSCVWLQSIIIKKIPTVSGIMNQIQKMPTSQQLEIYYHLQAMLSLTNNQAL